MRRQTIALAFALAACVGDAEEEAVMVCGDAAGETPMQECITQNLTLRESTLAMAVDTLVGRGLSRDSLDERTAAWRIATSTRCGPRPDSLPPAPERARDAWACYTGAYNEYMIVLRDLRR